MDTYINVTLRAFKVKIFDNRTLETKIDVIVFDKSVLQAAQLVGESSDNLIKKHYNRQGYTVIEIVEVIKREAQLNLRRLFEAGGEIT